MELKLLHTIRTNNFNDEQVMEKITRMWKDASAKLANHQGRTYGLYYEYESDYKGDYTLSVAIEEKSDASITIPKDTNYEVFKVDTAEEHGVLKAWDNIWEMEKEGRLNRAYTYDFEKYYPDGAIDIYIAVK